jgi:hypothetical protein
VEIVRRGTVCLDCGAQFARKKLRQAYVATGLGLLAGFGIASAEASEHNWGLAIAAPFIYTYAVPATFFGWHYGWRIWKGLASFAEHFSGIGGLMVAIVLLTFRLMIAGVLGVCGGGIAQYLNYRRLINLQRTLSTPAQTQAAFA